MNSTSRKQRNPLITEAGLNLFNRINQNQYAPRWTYEVGDRIEHSDLLEVERFRNDLQRLRKPYQGVPNQEILTWIENIKDRVLLFKRTIPAGFDFQRDWAYTPLTGREDVAVRPEELSPLEADLSRLIVYDTSGSTGHSIVVPHHPLAMAMYLPMIEFVLNRYGVKPEFGPDLVAFFNITARSRTVTFPNVFSVWNQSGFAKVNLNENEWPGGKDRARRFFADLVPLFLAGDPVGLAEMIEWRIPARPAVVFSTAVALSLKLKAKLEDYFDCPVVDWYSTTETGPIAFACREGFLHILPHDLFVETIDPNGDQSPEGEPGEIAVTGGRNPYLPLLRFRTGDYARLVRTPCPCGDPMPRLMNLEGRSLVAFRASDGSVVSQVDIGLVMRESLFIQHEFIQRPDGSCDIRIRPAPEYPVDITGMTKRLQKMFGEKTDIRIKEDKTLGRDSKVIPFQNEIDG